MAETVTKPRKPRARAKEIIFGALDERLQMLTDNPHGERIRDLVDELRRATNGKETEE